MLDPFEKAPCPCGGLVSVATGIMQKCEYHVRCPVCERPVVVIFEENSITHSPEKGTGKAYYDR